MLLCGLLIASSTACSHQPATNEYFCPPTVAYEQTGEVQQETYAVDRQCYKSMTLKMRACYTEVR
jgi:hypothetical protein